jgi:hypothetical protein
MITRREANSGLMSAAILSATSTLAAREATERNCRRRDSTQGKPLMQALKLRRSTREYFDRPISDQVLSDLLWAAFRINRPSGDRTAPYWRHLLVIDVYTAMADGVWLYEPRRHALIRHLSSDIRAQTGQQDFVGHAPLNLVYVAHGERMHDIPPDERRFYASVDTHRPERLSLLRLGGSRQRIPRRGRLQKARRPIATSRGRIRHLCPDRPLRAWVNT